VLIVGWKLYGKTQQVPGIFHVATEFFHVYYFPILPKQSYVVLDQTPGEFRGVPIELSWRSIVIAWLRGAMFIPLLFSGVMALGICLHFKFQAVSLLFPAVTIALALALWRSYHWRYFRYATYERAMQLATAASFNEVGMLAIGVHFGKITAEQAAATHDALASADVQEILPPGAATVIPARR
jgi:hypothetical protein